MPLFKIRPTKGFRFLDLRALWAYRELIYFLIWRDIKVRYKQTAIGVVWAVLQPIAMVLVFWLFFGRLARIPSEGLPYPLFVLAALLPWQLFSRALSDSSNSLLRDQRLITRVYFPRIIVPISTIVAALLDFLITAFILLILLLIYGVAPGLQVLYIPLCLLLLLITALGVGFWFSALNVEYRDVVHVLPFLTQLWFFLTPVVYPGSMIPESWRLLYGLNPMVGVVEGFRWALLGTGKGPGLMFLISALVALAIFVSGIVWFRRRERTFVDALGSGGR